MLLSFNLDQKQLLDSTGERPRDDLQGKTVVFRVKIVKLTFLYARESVTSLGLEM